jgi:AraC family transcriptional regulator, arabinose operon regulatory protein
MDGPADFIHDSAMRLVTRAPFVDRILTGNETREHVACWRPNGTDDWLLIYTIRGEGRVSAAGSIFAFNEGDTVLFRPRTPQDFGTEAPWTIVWAHFEPLPHWLELLQWPELAPGVLHISLTEPSLRARVQTLLLESNRLFESGLPHAERLAENALEGALLWCFLQDPARRSLDPRVVAAIDLLTNRIEERTSIADVARGVHLSVSRFAHLFKQETGVSPRRFAEQQRLERAKRLLELTTLPVHTVATEVGFRSPFYFATRFKKLTGRTPNEFRSARLRGETIVG